MNMAGKRGSASIAEGRGMFFGRKFTLDRLLLVVGQLWAVPLVLLMRVLRPLVIVRINFLVSEFFGHYSGNVELYLCERDAGINRLSSRHVDLWFNQSRVVSNRQLEKMWKRELTILPRALLAPVYRLNRAIPGGRIHEIESTYHDRDVHNLLGQQPPHAVFTPEEAARGRRLLLDMGVPEGAPFVCLNVRDGAFHRQKQFTNYRNADVREYMLAAEELAARGYYVLRMGKRVEYPFESTNARILDYASSAFRSDFMDIYLGAGCSFAISTSSGWDNVPGVLFRRPILYTDVVPMSQVQSWSSKTLAIFKRHRLVAEGRYLTQSEIFELIDREFVSSDPNFDAVGVELVANTAEEIRDAAVEMVESILPGNVPPAAEDRLQNLFWSIYRRNLERFDLQHLHGEIRLRIGTNFLAGAPEFTQDAIDQTVRKMSREPVRGSQIPEQVST